MVNMRKQYVLTTEDLSDKDERVITLLGDIGVYTFHNIKDRHPNQVHNLGILEPASISIAAGLARVGFIPFFHTLSQFVVERPFEQLKVDFAYQHLGGNFVGVGASYDDGGLGMTHYCPGDVAELKTLPNMQIVIPGTAAETDSLIRQAYDNGEPTYYRLSTATNSEDHDVSFGKANIIRMGSRATVIAVGPMLDMVLEGTKDLDVTVLYYTTVEPFDGETLKACCKSRKVLLCEPYYTGALTNDIIKALGPGNMAMDFIGVPHEILTTYGTSDEINEYCGITAKNIRSKLEALI